MTGGLAAPLVAAGMGVAFGTATGVALGTTAGIYTIGVVFGATGAGLVAYKSKKRYGALQRFEFVPLESPDRHRSTRWRLSFFEGASLCGRP